MFSYLRPHRRTPSTPSSPAPETLHSWGEPPLHTHAPSLPLDTPSLPIYQDESSQSKTAAAISPLPILPPVSFVGKDDYSIDPSSKAHDDVRSRNIEPTQGNSKRAEPSGRGTHQSIFSVGRPASAEKVLSNSPTYDQLPLSRGKASKQKLGESSPSLIPADSHISKSTTRKTTGARLPTPLATGTTSSNIGTVQPRSGKVRNLLNPMSLLARRRTSQAVAQLAPVSIPSRNGGDDFDPRIKGTVVHDFSAPRPRRNQSSNDVGRFEGGMPLRHYQRSPNAELISDDNVGSHWSGGNHTPVFTENFEEEQYPAAGPHVRKTSDVSDLPVPKPPYARGQARAESKQRPPELQCEVQEPIQNPGSSAYTHTSPLAENDLNIEKRRISIDPASTPPRSSLAKSASKIGRSRNVSEVSARELAILGLPKHMTSTSSRFSFDMLGAAEQERILEDRHREKALRKTTSIADEDDDEEEDDYDYDDMIDDDGLEERIPGVNADYEDELEYDEDPVPGVNEIVKDLDSVDSGLADEDNIAGFTFSQTLGSGLTSPASPYSADVLNTPRDANGDVIGFAMTKESPYINVNSPLLENYQSKPLLESSQSLIESEKGDGLGLRDVYVGENMPMDRSLNRSLQPATLDDDDDLYYDDGMIDDISHGDGTEFDESVFDRVDTDSFGRPLNSFNAPPVPDSPSENISTCKENKDQIVTRDVEAEFAGVPSAARLAPEPSISEPAPSKALTQDTLAAYQSALAAAAQDAAARGKFERQQTPSDLGENHPGLMPDSSEVSGYEPFSPTYDDFDYDDALEDDPIIAAANAEALANDCEGFYGQEFGFYSAPAGETQYANGGYFGPRGTDPLNRSQSGRLALREPNLTPITERSEYSNRNSIMSLQLHGSLPAGSLNSPGLTQLAGMMNGEREYDGDMSLHALMKLRSRAWGGSQVSLHSSTGSPRSPAEDSSSIGQNASWNLSSPIASMHRRKNSSFSLVSEEGSNFAPVRNLGVPASSKTTSTSAPSSPTLTRAHDHSSSLESTDSVQDEGQEWVLERRRTAGGGEILM